TVASYARVDYAKRAGIEQTLCQTLRGHVAVWREAIGKLLVLADVVQFRTKIRQIVVVCALLLLEPVHLRELDGLVERDFSLRRLYLETRIPCAPIWTVAARTTRALVAACGVDDTIMR